MTYCLSYPNCPESAPHPAFYTRVYGRTTIPFPPTRIRRCRHPTHLESTLVSTWTFLKPCGIVEWNRHVNFRVVGKHLCIKS